MEGESGSSECSLYPTVQVLPPQDAQAFSEDSCTIPKGGGGGRRGATDLIGPLLSLAFLSFRRGRGPPCDVKKSTSGRGGSENMWERRKEHHQEEAGRTWSSGSHPQERFHGRRDEHIRIHAPTRENLESITPSEISQTQKDTYCMIPLP